MKLVLNQPCLEPFDPTQDLRVVIACEDSTAAQQACTVLERIGNKCDGKGRLICSWWNFEVLAITVLKQLAATEAEAADMIVVAAHDRQELPEEVLAWISQRFKPEDYHPRALVALVNADMPENGAAQDILSQLKKAAKLGQMDFFTNGTEVELKPAPFGGGTRAAARQFDLAREYRAQRITGRGGKALAQTPGNLQTRKQNKHAGLMNTTTEQKTAVTQEAIAAAARNIWENEGCQQGRDLEYWFKAERQLLGDGQKANSRTNNGGAKRAATRNRAPQIF